MQYSKSINMNDKPQTQTDESVKMTDEQIKQLSLWEKIHFCSMELKHIQRDMFIEFGGTSYRGLSEELVTARVKAAMNKFRLVVFPVEQKLNLSDILKNGVKVSNLTTMEIVYKLLNIDNPKEYELIVSSGQGSDTQDKGAGKAMTYAYKYLFLRTFQIPTNDDPDKIHSDQLDADQVNAQQQDFFDRKAKFLEDIDQMPTIEALVDMYNSMTEPFQTDQDILTKFGNRKKYLKQNPPTNGE